MLHKETLDQLKEMQDLWNESIVSDSVLEEFLLKVLADTSSTQYDLSTTLCAGAIELLIRNGEQQLKWEDRGGVKMITNGRVVDLSHLAREYRKLFAQWQAKRWILIEDDLTVTKLF